MMNNNELRMITCLAGKRPGMGMPAPQTIIRNSAFVIVFLVALSCAAQKNSAKAYYHEDLYSLRPKFPEVVDSVPRNQDRKKADVVAAHHVNEKVNSVLDSINRFNVTRKLIDGYTIQIYSGQNREEAMTAKKKMVIELPGLSAELEYNQPKFRVKVGNYYSRLEAQKDMLNLKRSFPNAILVPEKIVVR